MHFPFCQPHFHLHKSFPPWTQGHVCLRLIVCLRSVWFYLQEKAFKEIKRTQKGVWLHP
jgi:hypothetical protein